MQSLNLNIRIYVAWLVRPSTTVEDENDKSKEQLAMEAIKDSLLACVVPHHKSDINDERASKRTRLEQTPRTLEASALKSICRLPLPQELVLQVISNLIPRYEFTLPLVKILVCI